jgi:hypothetical protein
MIALILIATAIFTVLICAFAIYACAKSCPSKF